MDMKERIWLSAPHMSGREQKYIEEAFALGHVFPNGANVRGLEEDICAFTKMPACACVSSGTASLHLALILLGIGKDDEVICSSYTFSASANPIVYQGARPIFVDSEVNTWNMDPDLLRYAIKDRIEKAHKTPKAIILVHLYGMPADMTSIIEIAQEFNIPIIEDAAEALGSKYLNQHCGTFGEMGIYSFNGNKIITTSGGGALVAKNPEYCQKAVFLATQARDHAPHYQHSEIGYNYRMSNISAGIGRGQMEVIDQRIAKRRENFFYYRDQLNSIKELEFLEEPSEAYFSNHWLTTATIAKNSDVKRDELIQYLVNANIETRPLWKPMHLQPVFKEYPAYVNGISEDLFNRGLCLPSSSNLSEADRQFTANSIRRYFK